MTIEYSCGAAHEPSIEDVVNCIAMETTGIWNVTGFEEWATDYGYDTDSRKAYDIYQACFTQGESFRRAVGRPALEELVNKVEQL